MPWATLRERLRPEWRQRCGPQPADLERLTLIARPRPIGPGTVYASDTVRVPRSAAEKAAKRAESGGGR
jgi:hypothetical protein